MFIRKMMYVCFTDDCVNPESFVDYDMCAGVTESECEGEDSVILREWCPAVCACRKFIYVFIVCVTKESIVLLYANMLGIQ